MTNGVLYEPTEEQRRTVKAMAGYGVPQDDIANHLEIDAKTLRKHFRRELSNGTVEANAKVGQSLFNMATSGGNVAAAIFWMKARAGWREKHDVQVSGPGGGPVEQIVRRIIVDPKGPNGHPDAASVSAVSAAE
jgi:hypothetical protein